MTFLQNYLPSMVTNLYAHFSTPVTSFTVLEVDANRLSRYKEVARDDAFILYQEHQKVLAVLLYPPSATKAFVHVVFCFSLFHDVSTKVGVELFSIFSSPLLILIRSCESLVNKEGLQAFSDALRSHPTWNSAHMAVKLKQYECLKQTNVARLINKADPQMGMTPVMVAIEADDIEGIKLLITLGARLDVADRLGRNVFHYAIHSCNDSTIHLLATTEKSAINGCDVNGETALHEACLEGRDICVENLLRWGADPRHTKSTRYPIHSAMKSPTDKCMILLCNWSRDQVRMRDKKHNAIPLHWAEHKERIKTLIEMGSPTDEKTKTGLTPLHVMVRMKRYSCAMALLIAGADATALDNDGNSSVHMAIQIDNWELVQLMIVFGADVNARNKDGYTARHMAATGSGKNKEYIIYLLNHVGAQRCTFFEDPMVEGCTDGCGKQGSFDGIPRSGATVVSECYPQRILFDKTLTNMTLEAAMARTGSGSALDMMRKGVSSYYGLPKRNTSTSTSSFNPFASTTNIGFPSRSAIELEKSLGGPRESTGDRLLCLDGGGVKGLILMQILLAIEKAAGRPIVECFDWIGGSSTGAILALALVHGRKSVRGAVSLYFEMSAAIFNGKRPYDSVKFEGFLQQGFGAKLYMDAVKYPRTVAFAVLGDRFPAELHLFRNYLFPGEDLPENESQKMESAGKARDAFQIFTKPCDQLVWAAARASGAAPTYFRASGPFLDGGMMANNPTIDLMTEVISYYSARNIVNGIKKKEPRPIHLVVSLGTGCNPVKAVEVWDVFRPEAISDVTKVYGGIKTLIQHLITETSASDGRITERAAAWCNSLDVPFFRFNPQLSKEITLDCTDEKELVNMLWETQGYLYENSDRINELATLLKDT